MYKLAAFADEADGSLEGQIKACKANGITHMELRGFGDDSVNDLSVDEAKKMKKELDEAGMHVSSIGSCYGKINITMPQEYPLRTEHSLPGQIRREARCMS